jgi:hypothetical protein
MAAGSDWLLLSEVDHWLDDDAYKAAYEIIRRGRVPVSAFRSDILGSDSGLPERVETLLAKARSPALVLFSTDEISARFDSKQDRGALFGPQSWLLHRHPLLGDPEIRFSSVRIRWPELAEELATAGYTVRGAKHPRPGPKGGDETSIKRLAWEIAEEILLDDTRRPRRGYGRLAKLARAVNSELSRHGHQRQDDSVRKMIGPSLREWEGKNPDK